MAKDDKMDTKAKAAADDTQEAWFLKYSCPILLPEHTELFMSNTDFEAHLATLVSQRFDSEGLDPETDWVPLPGKATTDTSGTETFTLLSAPSESTSAEIRDAISRMDVSEASYSEVAGRDVKPGSKHPFMEGLKEAKEQKDPEDQTLGENKMLTENGDITNTSTKNALVDLFSELEDVVSGPRLIELLNAAWAADPLITLKIIFNSRSIHLGKSSRSTFYRAAGWLAINHPLTLIYNLRWLTRPVIEKKVKKEGEEDAVFIEHAKDEDDPAYNDVKHGVAHGYWKDMLNLLAIAANGKLNAIADPRDVLNSENPGIIRGKSVKKRKRQALVSREAGRGAKRRAGGPSTKETDNVILSKGDSKTKRRDERASRHQNATKLLKTNPVYLALHLSIARLFAEQLMADLAILKEDNTMSKVPVSLCGKWAPTHDHFHDRHTFIVSSIAEIMHPRASFDGIIQPTDSRETYLRYAREKYRTEISALRKRLAIVERDITEKNFAAIHYDRVPSLAMSQYASLFIEKDLQRFEKYMEKVAKGTATISGATLLPSTLIHQARTGASLVARSAHHAKGMLEKQQAKLLSAVQDGQWTTLVKRIKESGTLSSSIAVCDVSGSMMSPVFRDGTCPMDSSVGLSLLLAEVTEPPFGGSFITFADNPTVQTIDLTKPLSEKIRELDKSNWSMSTNFTAIFLDLILPMAKRKKLTQEEMVKRVFVFSDMHFNSADSKKSAWTSSYGRIQKAYKEAGYEVPELIFWNLAGSRQTVQGNRVAPKPVTMDEVGTSLVSGYSQAMLKVFLDNGSFDEEEEEEEQETPAGEEDKAKPAQPAKKKVKSDPFQTVKKAIGHKAYDMLRVVD